MCSLTHTVKEIEVSLCVHQADGVAGVIRSRQYTIPSEYVERIDGEYFISLNRKHVYARRILCMQSTAHQQTAHADDGIANLSKSDVIDQLIAIRHRAVKLAVVEGNSDKVDKLKRRWHKSRKLQESICALVKTMWIATPEISGIPSMQLRILTALKGPLWVQLSDGMLTWLTRAIKYQVESGGVKSKRAKRMLMMMLMTMSTVRHQMSLMLSHMCQVLLRLMYHSRQSVPRAQCVPCLQHQQHRQLGLHQQHPHPR